MLCLAASSYAQPKITSFSPVSGPVGTQLTISGSGFNTGPEGNFVTIGPVRTAAAATTPNSLTVIVPVGAATDKLSVVNNATRLAGYASTDFVVSYPNPFGKNILPSFFQPRVDFSTNYLHPSTPTFSDFDGDGKTDLVFTDVPSAVRERGTVVMWKNVTPTGTITSSSFTQASTSQPDQFPGAGYVKDMNNDGKPDIFITLGSVSSISVGGASVPYNSGLNSFVAGDVDADGKPDLILAYSNGTLAVMRSLFNPASPAFLSFAPAVNFATGLSNLTGVQVNDLDGDGKPELVATGSGAYPAPAVISLLHNTSSPGSISAASFEPYSNITLAGNNTLGGLKTADVDSDGKPDLLLNIAKGGVRDSSKIAILRNVSTQGTLNAASFAPEADIPAGSDVLRFNVGDVDGDGKLDLLVINNASGSDSNPIAILLNNSTPGSITPSSFVLTAIIPEPSASNVNLLDLDNDGKPELVVSGVYPSQTSYLIHNLFSVAKIRQQPYPTTVTSVSPLSAPAGATVTITGISFNENPSANIVYFGAVKATVTGGTSSSLTVTVPPGATYQPVTVLNTATGLSGSSPLAFLPTFANPAGSGIAPGFYKTKVDFASGTPAGAYPYSFAIGDVDGDGKPDMAIVHANSNIVTVLHNTSPTGSLGASSFTQQASFNAGPNPLGVQIRDMDGDGKPDLVVVKGLPDTAVSSGLVSVLRNTTVQGSLNSGSFAPKVDIKPGTKGGAYSVAIGDINSDGKPDIVLGNLNFNAVSVILNASTPGSITAGSFDNEFLYYAPSPRAVAVADMDGDGVPDIVVANEQSNTVAVLRNQASNGILAFNTFNTAFYYPVDSLPNSLVISDLDGDGKPDIVAGNAGSNTIAVLRNLSGPGTIGPNSFSAKFSFATGSQPFSIAAGDADGDGKPDIIVANAGSNTLSILRNAGIAGGINAATFLPKVDFVTGVYPVAVAIADLDGDGIAEAAAVNAASSSVSVLKIGAPSSTSLPPMVASLTPASVYAGSSLTITGSNFNPVPTGNTVYFGAVKATITGGNANSLTVIVPAGATHQPVSVLNNANGLTGYSSKPFFPTFPNPFGLTIPADFYLPRVDLAAGNTPAAVTASDLDGDGKPDLMVVNQSPGNVSTVSIYRNLSAGGTLTSASFAPKFDVLMGNYAGTMIASDVDGDGKPDIVVVNGFGFSVSVLRNTSAPGSISFAPQVDFATNQYPGLSAVTDVDKDGKPDIVVRYGVPPYNCSIYRNTSTPGNISASSFTKIDISTTGQFQAIADMDSDGKPDLVLYNPASGITSVSRNISSPGSISNSSFGQNTIFGYSFLKIGDVDGNGMLDLLTADSVRLNYSTPGNISSTAYPASKKNVNFPLAIAPEDVDGDGKPDLIGSETNQLTVQRNLGQPQYYVYQFAPPTTFAASGTPLYTVVVDLNGDGISETVVSNFSSNSLSIFQINTARKAPAITSLSPDSSATGTTVNIRGVNFNTDPAANIVYFGAVRAQVTRATNFELAVTVPAGATYQYATVLNRANGLTGYAFRPFTHTFVSPYGSAVPANFYRPRTDFATGALPYGMAMGDLDGDGKSEIVTANFNDNTVSVLYNNSSGGQINTGSFSARTNFTVGANPYAVAIGDVDGDGKADLVVANYGASTVSVLRNTTAGSGIGATSFASKVDYPVGSFTYPISVAIGDVDGDGKADLVTANSLSNTVSVLRNTSTTGSITPASFALHADFATGAFPHSVAIGDVDGDYRPDVVTANQQAGTVSVLRNTAVSGSINASSLAPKADFAVGSDPYSVVIGDLNRDQKPELLIANHSAFGNGALTALRNVSLPGTVNFDAAQRLLSNSNMPFSAIIADVNGDGEPDVVQTNSASGKLSILPHLYSYSGEIIPSLFGSPAEFATGGYPVAVAAGDLDGDGLAEVVTANAAGSVSVFKITSAAQAVAGSAGSFQSAASDKAATQQTGLRLYPNPTSGSLTLQLLQPGGPVVLEVLDAAGKTLQKRQVNAAGSTVALTVGLSLHGQPAGVYYIKMTGVNGIQLEKVVLQR